MISQDIYYTFRANCRYAISGAQSPTRCPYQDPGIELRHRTIPFNIILYIYHTITKEKNLTEFTTVL